MAVLSRELALRIGSAVVMAPLVLAAVWFGDPFFPCLIALAAVLLGVFIVIILWRVRGWDPRWLRRWRHATAEAGWRVGLNGAELRDFVHLGR